MSWIEIELSPQSEWNEDGLENWAQALGSFLLEKGMNIKPRIQMLPGYNVLQLGREGSGELTLSRSERLVILDGLLLKGDAERDFARFAVRLARHMGAVGFCVASTCFSEREFWEKLGGVIKPDPVPLPGSIYRRKVALKQLAKFSLLVMYDYKPVLCLEPITSNSRLPGPVSLAQRRLEKMYGGNPLGFSSRVAVHCPWVISQEQWDDLLSFSRLQAFDLLEEIVLNSQET